MPQAESATRKGAPGRIEVFEYLAGSDASSLPEWDGLATGEETSANSLHSQAGESGGGANELLAHAEFGKRLAEETHRSSEAGRERGRQEGRQAEREAQAASLAAAEQQHKRQAVDLIVSFTQERDRFLQMVEHEVVKLALAVAARILRREAQMDPLLLTGAVRVALGQLSGSTQVRLYVPAAELDLWTEAMTLLPNLAVKPAVLAGAEMRLGDCKIETELGTVDLGIRSQLGEIERGFFDRAGGSRAVTPKAGADEMADAGRENR